MTQSKKLNRVPAGISQHAHVPRFHDTSGTAAVA